MAHLDKYDRRNLRRILKETYREYEDPDKYENEVDPTQTYRNYNFNPRVKSSYDFMNELDDRVAEIIETKMDGKPPRNPPKYGSWVITLPEELSEEATGSDTLAKQFFAEFWSFCRDRYGSNACVDEVVHMDETTPHCTLYVIPECISRKSGKYTISSATVFSREDLRTFHEDFDKRCELAFGRKNLVLRPEEERKADPKNLSLREYKLAMAQSHPVEADEQAEKIITAAKTKAATIISEANAKAEEIVSTATKKAEQINALTEAKKEECRQAVEKANKALTKMRTEATRIRGEINQAEQARRLPETPKPTSYISAPHEPPIPVYSDETMPLSQW